MILKVRFNGWFKDSTDTAWFKAPLLLKNGDVERVAFGGWLDVEKARQCQAQPVKIVAFAWSEDGIQWNFIRENTQFIQGAYCAEKGVVYAVTINGVPRVI